MKNILIGVTGGIACYKTIEIVNQLTKDGYNVEVIMTKSAEEFIRPLTFHTMSGNPVITDMFGGDWTVKHIELAKKADVFAIVPATANIIGKLANGIADDMLSTTALVVRCPAIIAPAMNTFMYENPIVQNNIQKLKDFGYRVLDTATGLLACKDEGKGKLLPWEEIYNEIKKAADETT